MPHALDGARFKIIWAHQHVDELKRHIGLYFDNTPYAVPARHQGNVVVVLTPKLYAPPHLDIGGIIGDCLCAMMAVLDYIMWELCCKYAGRQLLPKPLGGNDNVSFPLYVDPTKWQKADFAANRAPHYKLPADVVREIAAVQPCNAGYEPLWFLYVLVNQDKHRFAAALRGTRQGWRSQRFLWRPSGHDRLIHRHEHGSAGTNHDAGGHAHASEG